MDNTGSSKDSLAMNNTGSDKSMQFPISKCETCEEQKPVSWKCLDCAKKICNKCKLIHCNMNTHLEHRIVSVTVDPKSLKKRLNTIRCPIHEEEAYCHYCVNCSLFVCPNCVTEKHQFHPLRNFSDFQIENFNILLEKEANIETQLLKFFELQVKRLDEAQERHEREYDEQKNIIEQLEEKRIAEIKEESKILRQELQQSKDEALLNIEEEKSRIHKIVIDLNDKMCEIDHVKKSNNIQTICTVTQEILQYVEEVDCSWAKVPLEYKKFKTGRLSKESIRNLLGEFEMESHPSPIDISCLKSYYLEDNNIGSIRSNEDGYLWVNNCHDQIPHYYDLQHKHISAFTSSLVKCQFQAHFNTQLEISCDNVIAIAVTKSGNLLFTTSNDKEPGLNLLKLDGTICSLDYFDTSKFFKPPKSYSISKNQLVVSLHLSKDNGTIVAGLVNQQTSNSCDHLDAQIALLTIDENLHKYRIYHYLYQDTRDECLICYPYKIMSNIDGCISVIDLLANRIVTLDLHGKQKWIYDGILEESFLPTDISTTSFRNVIVCDLNNYLHILNAEGDILKYQATKSFNIEKPFTMTIDNEGRLIIVGLPGKGNYSQVHLLKFKGF